MICHLVANLISEASGGYYVLFNTVNFTGTFNELQPIGAKMNVHWKGIYERERSFYMVNLNWSTIRSQWNVLLLNIFFSLC